MPGTRTYTNSHYSLVLDGVKCGFIKSISGGGVSAEVINEPLGSDHYVKKHIGSPKYEDFIMQVGLQMAGPVYNWLTASWNWTNQRKTGAIVALDLNMNAKSQREFFNALITETTIPACDATSKEPACLTIKFSPEYTRNTPASGKDIGELPKPDKVWLPSNFRLEINDLDCTVVSKIDAFTVKQAAVTDEIGDARDYQKEPGKIEFPNLKITVSETRAQTWFDWHEDFVIKGNNDESKEKNGTLFLLAPDKKTELARINFYNLGIFKITSDTADAADDRVKRVTAELYCERMEFVFDFKAASRLTRAQLIDVARRLPA